MVSREALEEHFSNMGATLTDAVLAKCEELCIAYSVDEEELAETWTAYSCSKNVNIDPTLETLSQMERAEFGKKKKTASALPPTPSQSLVIYNTSQADESFEDDILSTYSATPKAKSTRAYNGGNTPKLSSPRVVFSPASFSPTVATPSARYASRSNAGTVLCALGNAEKVNWSSSETYKPMVRAESSVPADSSYMFDTLKERASLHEMNMRFVGNVIMTKAGIKETQEVSEMHTDEFHCWGRICYTSGTSLSLHNISLESFHGINESSILRLEVKDVPKLSVFPGQVVAIRAKNPTRSELVVQDIFSDASMPFPERPILFSTKGPLQIVIASGPYTQVDTMTYQPLEDLLEYLKKHAPHVAILIGPFIDANHPHVKDGLLAESFASFFEKQIDRVMQSVVGLQTQVVLVASSQDAHHHAIFPTPEYVLKKKYTNLLVVGDPCVIDIEGLKVAVTSVDVLKHLGNEEIVNSAYSQDRLGRLAKHILMQNNFYPLYPPNEQLNLDTNLWYDHCHLSFTPHILVLPSVLRSFVKEISGCVVVNPEHLAKGCVGGSFARLEVKADGKFDSSSVACQVIKI